ncbi:MAG: hypothetical protein HY827_09075 [Actinobacteria bacterium]|nr:hypothetical protein [Actinomycetota bacterium]
MGLDDGSDSSHRFPAPAAKPVTPARRATGVSRRRVLSKFGRLFVAAAVVVPLLMPYAVANAVVASDSAVVSISNGPSVGKPANSSIAAFAFATTVTAASYVQFECAIDFVEMEHCSAHQTGECLGICSGTTSTGSLPDGLHTFRVRAYLCPVVNDCGDPLNWIGGPSLERRFGIDTALPIASITSAPTVKRPALTRLPQITVASNEPGHILCSIKKGTSPSNRSGLCDNSILGKPLRNGVYTLKVVAVDLANHQSLPLIHRFKVDAFTPRKCKRGKSAASRATFRRCKAANRRARQRWQRRNGIGSAQV